MAFDSDTFVSLKSVSKDLSFQNSMHAHSAGNGYLHVYSGPWAELSTHYTVRAAILP
jgi:hypothetical protein